MSKTQKFVTVKHFEGLPKVSDFQIVEETLKPLEDREILAEALWISVDPYQRVYTQRYPLGTGIHSYQVAKVVQSRHDDYKEGDIICNTSGWQTLSVIKPDGITEFGPPCYHLPKVEGVSPSLGVGALGMPGNTALFGFLEICNPKPGEIVVVSGAAGAVGSHVAQIAKHLGCLVIGITGSDKKVQWLLNELKLDAAINYKTTDLTSALAKAAPIGIDCYFDNVGGEISSTVLYQMKNFGRVSVCGSISAYNSDVRDLPKATVIQPALIFKQIKIEGFIVHRWKDRFLEGVNKNLQSIKEGWLKCPEHITDGFEKLPEAFIGMLSGDNIGKAVVKI